MQPNWRRVKREYKKAKMWKTPRGRVNGSNRSLHTFCMMTFRNMPRWSMPGLNLTRKEW